MIKPTEFVCGICKSLSNLFIPITNIEKDIEWKIVVDKVYTMNEMNQILKRSF